MNKKIVSLFLALVLMLGMLSGCSNLFGEKEEEESGSIANTNKIDDRAMTLTLWLPTDENTTDEAIELVEDEINALTTSLYNTAIELHAIPRDEYQAAVEARLKECEAEKIAKQEEESKKAETATESESESEEKETEEETDPTYVNDLGITVIKYPQVESDQMDIFFIQGKSNYDKYIEAGYLSSLAGEIAGHAKALTKVIYPTFFEVLKSSGTHAIPNNHPVGEYKYLLVNKKLVEKYDYNPDNLTTLLDCSTFIKDIGYQNLDGVTPLLGKVEPQMIYWGNDSSKWSVIASLIPADVTKATNCAPTNIFANKEYVNTVGLMKELEELGYVGNGKVTAGKTFAVGVISGDARVVEEYEDDYYIHIYSKPTFTAEDVYSSMFAVSSYTKNLSRSMQIVTYLNTNEEFRTLLQYGVEDIHWEYEDESKDTIRILNKDYSMNLYETGNVYMTYPGEGQTIESWSYGKQQNLDSIYLNFPAAVTSNNKATVNELDPISAKYKKTFDSLTLDQYKEMVTRFERELASNETVSKLLDASDGNSFVGIYDKWYKNNNPTK